MRGCFFDCGFRVAQDFRRTVIRYVAQGFQVRHSMEGQFLRE